MISLGVVRFTCDVCGRGFHYNSRLQDHRRRHISLSRKHTGLFHTTQTNKNKADCRLGLKEYKTVIGRFMLEVFISVVIFEHKLVEFTKE